MQKKIIYICVAVLIFFTYMLSQTKDFVSVVIPVYNAEKYISRCIDSVIIQKGIKEIIIVNDVSTDNTSKIIENYAKNNSKIKIINQDNQGVSVARNKGIEQAKAEYITFVDSDDWLEPNAFKKVLNIIKKDSSDVVLTGFFDVYDHEWVKGIRGEESIKEVPEESKFRNKNLDTLVLLSPFKGKEAHKDLFYVGGGVRARFFSNEFIKRNNISFPDDVNCYEDDVFLYRTFLNNPKISVLNEPIYNYRNRLDSISKSKDILQCGPKSLDVMKNSYEYKTATRREQMLISDSFVAYIFLSISNMRRHKINIEGIKDEAHRVYNSFEQYNRQERKSCRNYIELEKILYPNYFNRGF